MAGGRVSPRKQIIGILKEHQAGLSAAQLCRKHGIGSASFCKYKAKYGGMEGEALACHWFKGHAERSQTA